MLYPPPDYLPPLFLLRNPNAQVKHPSSDLETHHRQLAEQVVSLIPKYQAGQPNPERGIATGCGNCIAHALAYSALSSSPEIVPVLLVVGSEVANSSHCLSGLVDRRDPSIFGVSDNYTHTLVSTDPKDDSPPEVHTFFTFSKPGFQYESFFGGMTTAIALLADYRPRLETDVITLDGTEMESKWSVAHETECRLTKTIVTGFFGNAIKDIADYITDGVKSETADSFVQATRQFTKTKVQ